MKPRVLGLRLLTLESEEHLPEANSQAIYERMISERVREAKEFRAKGSEIAQKIRAEADKERTVILVTQRKVKY